MSDTQKNFVKGAIILAIAGLIAKIIGAFFRIPLVNIIGTEGIGYYSMAYPVYSLLAVVSTAGIPSAISKTVAEHIATGNEQKAHDTFKVALKALIALGIVSSILMFFLSPLIADVMKSTPAVYSLMAISPALFFVAIISAYRGYFQGMELMKPTAFSQLLEQLGKLLVGLSLAYVFYNVTKKPELGAFGALLGIALSEIGACAYIIISYKKFKKNLTVNTKAKISGKPILEKLIKLAVPVVLGACIMPIILSVDSVLVPRVLQSIGYAQRESAALYGILTGVVNPLINMPAILSLALAMSLVPAISTSFVKKDMVIVKEKTSFGIKLAIIIGLPAAVGFFILASPIIRLLYGSVVGEELVIATSLFQILSLGVLFLTFVQTITGILQGLSKPMFPVYSLIAGAIVKVIVSVILMRMPQLNIRGAAIGTLCCFAVAAVMNIVFVIKHSKIKISISDHVLKPLAATVAMAVIVWLVYGVVGIFSNTVGVVLAIIFGIIVYAMVILFSSGLSKGELYALPGGSKIIYFLIKMRVMK